MKSHTIMMYKGYPLCCSCRNTVENVGARGLNYSKILQIICSKCVQSGKKSCNH